MNENKPKKAWYKKWWVWVIIVFVLIGIGGGASGNKGTTTTSQPSTTTEKPSAGTKPKEEKWDVEAAYAKLTDGMTKAEAEAAIGKTTDSCSETSAQYVGTIESCNYGSVGDNGIIMVQYQDGKLSTKSKTKY